MSQPNKMQKTALTITRWIGSPSSIITHTVIFILSFLAAFLGLIGWSSMLLVLTTIVSLEAIYLAIFIQMTINFQGMTIEEVEKDIDEIQEDIDEMQEDVEEIQEDVDELQEDVEDIEEIDEADVKRKEAQKQALESIQADLQKLLTDMQKPQEVNAPVAKAVVNSAPKKHGGKAAAKQSAQKAALKKPAAVQKISRTFRKPGGQSESK